LKKINQKLEVTSLNCFYLFKMKVAIIPARGGSKRIPRKNIKKFCGKPIIAWSIIAALESEIFDRVLVSTDDKEIAKVANEYGAETPFVRPKELSDDFQGTNAVVKHAIQWLEEHDQVIEYVCCIYATAPFIQANYLKEGLKVIRETGNQFAFSVTTYDFPVQRAIKISSDRNAVEPMWAESILQRSQDLEEAYHDAGQFYWGLPAAFLEDKDLFSCISSPVLIPRYLVQDIDTVEDWVSAEFMYEALSLRGDYLKR